MLYIGTVSKKSALEISIFELLKRESCTSKLCPKPQIGGNTQKWGIKHAFHRIFDHFVWSKYQKKLASEISIFELQSRENCIS